MRRTLQVGPRAVATLPAAGGSVPGGLIDLKKRGARGDAKRLRIAITEGSTIITSSLGGLKGLEGRLFAISFEGGRHKTSIVSVERDYGATIADVAPATYSEPSWSNVVAGFDDSAAIQSCIASARSVYCPTACTCGGTTASSSRRGGWV